MASRSTAALLLCFLLFLQTYWALGWWFFSSSSGEELESLPETVKEEVEDEQPEVAPQLAKFEVANVEKKFLMEAQKYLESMSPLERCHHSVISKLQSSCGEMSDEELGKVSVHLLNCQSQAEGRILFPCDETMTLSECTGPMDSTTWNAYHIISNRARSVCYSVQQQRFRRQTEAAVNKLSESTLRQLQAVQELEGKHQQIKEFTEESLQNFQSNQELLSQKQEEVLSTQATLNDHIGQNLAQLSEEKNMIQSGQVLLTSMTEHIRKQLDEASAVLVEQEEGRKENHQKIVTDIDRVKQNIDQVWQRVDEGTGELLSLMENMSAQYENTLHNLALINASVSSMMTLLTTMNSALTRNLEWMTSRLGGAKEGLHILTTLAVHAAFLFLAVLCLVFVGAPGLARVALLVIATGNALMEIRFYWSLSITGLAALQALMLVGNWLFSYTKQKYSLNTPRNNISTSLSHTFNPTQCSRLPPQAATPKLSLSPSPVADISDDEPSFLSPPETLPINHTPFTASAEALSAKPLSTLSDTHSSEFTPPRPRRRSVLFKCQARTKLGQKCKLTPVQGSFTCKKHADY